MHRRTAARFGALLEANIAAWAWAWAAFQDRPALLGTALLAWVFGLRHAADADHIAAIEGARAAHPGSAAVFRSESSARW